MAKYLDQTGLTYLWGKVKGWVNNSQHPVGSIYISTSSTFDPAKTWGGTWRKTADGRCLIGANETYPLGSTGGEATHVLTVDELAYHAHAEAAQAGNGKVAACVTTSVSGTASGPLLESNAWTTNATTLDTGWVGKSKAHNNMQPYLAVYIWERTA